MWSDFSLFRSFLPLRNSIGFGASDFIELAVALLFAATIIFRSALAPFARKLAERTVWSMLSLLALTCALRLMLLPHCPAPVPSGADDFSYVLLGDTLRHFRLANPPHPLSQFFEAVFVLQNPTYSSIYPLGQGIALALGRSVFGTFWAGVLLSQGIFCACCYWMLRAWTAPQWAFIGGLLAIVEFGPLNQWMNSYWGGAVSGIAGCLVFGALPRLRRCGRTRHAALLGLGLAVQLLTRPFEFVLLCAAVALFWSWRQPFRLVWIPLLSILAALGLTLLQNRAVTGSWTTLPYQLSRYEYGVPTTLTFEPNPIPHRTLTPEQELDYRAQSAIHGSAQDTIASYLSRLWHRVRYLRFFWFAPLYLVAIPFLFAVPGTRLLLALLALSVFVLGANFYPYFWPHYLAAVACLFLLISVKGLEKLSRIQLAAWPAGLYASRSILALCGVQFLFWYGLYLSGYAPTLPITRYETADFINFGDPEGRIAVQNQLARSQGKQLVFVRYWPQHLFHEWIHNAADIDTSRVVWARDLGPEQDEKLIRYYFDRKVWLLEPDAQPPRLTPYMSSPASLLTVH